MKNQFQKGFTLVELLVVVALIGILAAVAILVINPASLANKSKDSVLSAQLDKIGLAAAGSAATDANQDMPTCAVLGGLLNNDTPVCASNYITMTVGSLGAQNFYYYTTAHTATTAGTACIAVISNADATKYLKYCSSTGTVTPTTAATGLAACGGGSGAGC